MRQKSRFMAAGLWRTLAALALVGGGVLAAAEISQAEATVTGIRLDQRADMGGRLTRGELRISPVAETENANAKLSIGGSSADGWTVASPVWDSASLSDGWHTATLNEGASTAAAELAVLNSDTAAVHGGVLEADEIWGADKLHIVQYWVRIPQGRTLTIESGTTVKFCNLTGLQVDGMLNASEAVFTHVADDTAGGDTDMNGEDGGVAYGGYDITGQGTKTLTSCEVRYAASLHIQTKMLSLKAGWNWVGFAVLPDDKTVSGVLGTSGFTANDLIQTSEGFTRFTGKGWLDASYAVDFGKLYQIYVQQDVTVAVTGEACDKTSLSIQAGWNWLANPMDAAVDLRQLNHSGGFASGDRIVTAGGNATYNGAAWTQSGLSSLTAGEGFKFFAAKAGVLSFQGTPAGDTYVVVDLSGGPDAASYPVRYTDTAPDVTQDACRTTELWLRKIPAGTYTMGSPEDELGRYSSDMAQHQVTLTEDFYIGVFECTQRQWELVMGTKPSYFENADCYATRPVELVSYDMIRGTGTQAGAGWPTYGHTVDSSSFMGRIQARTGLVFDLPTEAQWEYACRLKADGSCWTTALNSGKELTGTESCSNMAEVGRYRDNGGSGYTQSCSTESGTAKVGSYQPSELGLYDMHGNVCEWCLDWLGASRTSTNAETDPKGPSSGSYRVLRGGSWGYSARICRAANRSSGGPASSGWGSGGSNGFRVAMIPKKADTYLVVDLSGGPDAASYPVRYTDTAPDVTQDACRTTELWLRKIPAGTFTMGSPEDELGRFDSSDMAQHQVTLTEDFYIGVFECTQRQWELVMGTKPSDFENADCYATRPVEQVSYDMIRGTGTQAGAGWPTYGHTADASSFMGRIQEKTGLVFDLPTEAQWEYACRLKADGSSWTTALNSGKNLTNTSSDSNMAEVGRYWYNGGSGYSQSYSQSCSTENGTAKVGSYQPSELGLYDMHGNVWEWCLDWWGASTTSTNAETDPEGPSSGSNRVLRGGSWGNSVYACRAAFRNHDYPTHDWCYHGFRVACP